MAAREEDRESNLLPGNLPPSTSAWRRLTTGPEPEAEACEVRCVLRAWRAKGESSLQLPEARACRTASIPFALSCSRPVRNPDLGFANTHHSQTHHNEEAEKVRKVAAITEFNIAQFAYMIKRMHRIREGDGTLLDNCIMMWGSGLEDGNKHRRENLPFIVAGRGGGTINTGRFLTDVRGNQGDLLTTLLGCAGVPLDRPIGIATKQITEMTHRV